MSIRCGKGHYHEGVAEVRACYNGERVKDVATVRSGSVEPKPTEKQISFLERLLKENGLEYIPGIDSLNRRTISSVIGAIRDGIPGDSKDFRQAEMAPAKSKAKGFDPEKLEDGFYALPDPEGQHLPVVYKVIVAVHGSGRKYAKRLNTDTGEWDIARGSISLLRPEHKMTLDQALEVAKAVATDPNGALYGRCFKCGQLLTDEHSIERMMGPVCVDSFK